MPVVVPGLDPVRPVALEVLVQPNIIVFAPDDWGRDSWKVYADTLGTGVTVSNQAYTPNLDAHAQAGVRFNRAYVQPWCSPTRAQWMTGRWGYKTGIGALAQDGDQSLLDAEVCLPRALKLATGGAYTCGVFGKWHLAGFSNAGGPIEHPVRCGFDEFAGSLINMELPESYYSWPLSRARRTRDGIETSQELVQDYQPIWLIEEALRWVARTPQPWFLYLPISMPHGPMHRPPAEMYRTDVWSLDDTFPDQLGARNSAVSIPYYRAMVEAMDYGFGQLMNGLPQEVRAQTTTIVWADNGTAAVNVPIPPFPPGRSKQTVYDLGIRVPLVVAGAKVEKPGRTTEQIVSACDLLETVIDLAEGSSLAVPLPSVPYGSGTRNSKSFMPTLRNTAYGAGAQRLATQQDFFQPNIPHLNAGVSGDRCYVKTIESGTGAGTWKIIRKAGSGTGGWPSVTGGASHTGTGIANYEFYDLVANPNEIAASNLILGPFTLTAAQYAAYTELVTDYTTTVWSSY